MQRFQISQSDKETYVTHSGFALVGLALKHSGIAKALNKLAHRHGAGHGDCIKSYVGMLSIGKSDFDAIENRRQDRFFKKALGIKKVPSAPTLRQRFDKWAPQFIPLVDAASIDLISALKAPVTPFQQAMLRWILMYSRWTIQGQKSNMSRALIRAMMAMLR